MMKNLLLIALLLGWSTVFAQFSNADLQPLKILQGRWKSDRKSGSLIETWTVLNDSTMLGYSYIKTATDSIPEEKVELVVRAGKIFYIADAAGQNAGKPVPFTLRTVKEAQYTFENRAHDFPQRITYQLLDSNSLRAAIYGPMDGKETEVNFNFIRID